MAFKFLKTQRIIQVLAPETNVSVQNLLNAIRDYKDDSSSFGHFVQSKLLTLAKWISLK